ncbi:hypothetical protein IKQ21_05915 [bacterium]|nr:hypothetical protein [bacterium]
MKTEAIKQQIVDNYKQLSQLAKVERTNENLLPAWGLIYKHNGTRGFINQIGTIERNHASIRIIDGNELKLQKKPFYMTWKRTLKNINSMLESTIKNINNEEIITKRVVNIFVFSKDMIERLSKIRR